VPPGVGVLRRGSLRRLGPGRRPSLGEPGGRGGRRSPGEPGLLGGGPSTGWAAGPAAGAACVYAERHQRGVSDDPSNVLRTGYGRPRVRRSDRGLSGPTVPSSAPAQCLAAQRARGRHRPDRGGRPGRTTALSARPGRRGRRADHRTAHRQRVVRNAPAGFSGEVGVVVCPATTATTAATASHPCAPRPSTRSPDRGELHAGPGRRNLAGVHLLRRRLPGGAYVGRARTVVVAPGRRSG